MKSYKRTDRVGDLIMREIAMLLKYKGENPHFREVTVTHVRIAPDFSAAKVYITFLHEELIEEVLKSLNTEAYLFQNHLAHVMRLKRTPKLRFVYDESISRGREMDKLISAARGEDKYAQN